MEFEDIVKLPDLESNDSCSEDVVNQLYRFSEQYESSKLLVNKILNDMGEIASYEEFKEYYNNLLRQDAYKDSIYIIVMYDLGKYYYDGEALDTAIFFLSLAVPKAPSNISVNFHCPNNHNPLGQTVTEINVGKTIMNTHLLLSKCYFKKGLFKDSQRHYSFYLTIFHSAIRYNAEDLVQLDSAVLYSYRTINANLRKNLKNSTITFCRPSFFNDPLDSFIYHRSKAAIDRIESSIKNDHIDSLNKYEIEYKKKYRKEQEFMLQFHSEIGAKSLDKFRVKCFVAAKNYRKNDKLVKNMLMWSHYANSHHGICIRYRLCRNMIYSNNGYKMTKLCRVYYTNKPFLMSSEPIYDTETLFAEKNKCWEYENEVRLINYNPKYKSKFFHMKLSPDSRIEAVYFGCLCDNKDIEEIKNILGDSVEYYKMGINYNTSKSLIISHI